MSLKKDNERLSRGMKILNKRTLPQTPSTHFRISIGGNKTKIASAKKKQIYHYVMQSIIGESTAEDDAGETIDFILRRDGDADDDDLNMDTVTNGNLTVQLHLSGNVETKTGEIMKHVCNTQYMCPVCKNCFDKLSTLDEHAHTHNGERPFLEALKKHRTYHTGEKPYTCLVCNSSFSAKGILKSHMKLHTAEEPHICPECGKNFKRSTNLRNHAKTHIRPYECSICNEKCKTEKQLDRHVKTHNTRRQSKQEKLIKIAQQSTEHKLMQSEQNSTDSASTSESEQDINGSEFINELMLEELTTTNNEYTVIALDSPDIMDIDEIIEHVLGNDKDE